ncbi:MAG TPA: aldo/keto reductase [Terriglobia bacterium]|nr:aldo/keto reductase [Terriglobia bacterium]
MPSDSKIPGFATPEGTARFRGRFASRLPQHFREAQALWLSSIGLGTYLGEPTAEYDARYREAVRRAVEFGTNVFDSAINYRHQRSERAIGAALAELFASGSVRRDEVFVSTKGGFLTFDADEPDDPSAYFNQKLIEPGIVRADEVAAGCHVMSPAYLENQIEASRVNLGLETLDLYYVHNPETQLSQVSRADFYRRLKAAFAELEKAVAQRKIRMYGTATWNGYRAGVDSREAFSLSEALRLAQEVGGASHHFRALQLPYNLAMPEALTLSTQQLEGKPVPVLRVAQSRRLMVFASATLLQGQLASGMPTELGERLPGFQTDAQRAIQFVRSTPGITCALVGMSRSEHLKEDLSTARVAPLSVEQFRSIFAHSSGSV